MTEEVEQLVFDASSDDCAIDTVTVFVDAAEAKVSKGAALKENFAEITRVVKFSAPAGQVEVIIEGLPNSVKPDSIRAELTRATGCTILEVSNDTKTVTREDTEHDKQLKELDEQIAAVNRKASRLNKRKAWLQNYANSVVKTNTKPVQVEAGQRPVGERLMESSTLQKLDGFMGFYVDELKTHDAKMSEITVKIEELQRARAEVSQIGVEVGDFSSWRCRILIYNGFIQVMTEKANQLKKSVGTVVNRVLILLDVASDGATEIGLKVIYLITGGSWKASYDARVARQDRKLQVSFYGEVINGTGTSIAEWLDETVSHVASSCAVGEDWKNVNLALSSARPSEAGSLDPLPQAYVVYRNKNAQHVRNEINDDESISSAEEDEEEVDDDFDGEGATGEGELGDGVLTAGVETGGGATNFHIQRLATILSDGKPHKQTITIIDLNPTFSYAAAPKMSKFVYLKCATKNTSKFPLLPGTVAVYIDGSFIAYSYLNSVALGEEFGFFLGIDQAIKLEWTVEEKKDEASSTGILKKKNMKERKVSRVVKITNNQEEDATITVHLQVPESTDANIKVQLIEPNIKKKTGDLSFKKKNSILQCKNKVKKQSSWKFKFAYNIEWEDHGIDIAISDQNQDPVAARYAGLPAPAAKEAMQRRNHQLAWKAYQ